MGSLSDVCYYTEGSFYCYLHVLCHIQATGEVEGQELEAEAAANI